MQQWEYTTLIRKRMWNKERIGFEMFAGQSFMAASPWENFATGQRATDDLDQLLTWYGSQGWELVTVSGRSGVLGGDTAMRNSDFAGFTDEEVWVFKRPKQ